MIIPQSELAKFNLLNDLLAEFHGLKDKIAFNQIYAAKIQTLLQNSTRKSVGCTARLPLNTSEEETRAKIPDTDYQHKHYVLTREGIKEEFGYNEDFKCRKPSFSVWWPDYVHSKVATANLIKLIGHKEVRCEAALKEHIQMRKDFLKLNIKDGDYFAQIDLPNELKTQDSVEGGGMDAFSTKTLVFKLGKGWEGTEIVMVDGVVTPRLATNYQEEGYDYDQHDLLGHKISFVGFLRYSEQATYDVLVKEIQNQIVEVNKYIKIQTAQVEAVIAKYGQYLVFSEL